jgi:Holliday junction resolvasome RuvABC endonuclease subunit
MACVSKVPAAVSPQTAAINDLYFTEHADAIARLAQRDGSVKVTLWRDGQDDPVCVAFVFPDGTVRQEVKV